ncbi:hypothetical protein ADUPG1_009991 [Aduncisulcus paluster]|uniref:Uncharacterized protein n=1 Tax=Aduncisulcus paluster TaxID=2918883 RepID=A0ABQ5KYL2_9EUKA|nr:hypothetical protein ADUPG1_009991 [Aduncisulcus paluster]
MDLTTSDPSTESLRIITTVLDWNYETSLASALKKGDQGNNLMPETMRKILAFLLEQFDPTISDIELKSVNRSKKLFFIHFTSESPPLKLETYLSVLHCPKQIIDLQKYLKDFVQLPRSYKYLSVLKFFGWIVENILFDPFDDDWLPLYNESRDKEEKEGERGEEEEEEEKEGEEGKDESLITEPEHLLINRCLLESYHAFNVKGETGEDELDPIPKLFEEKLLRSHRKKAALEAELADLKKELESRSRGSQLDVKRSELEKLEKSLDQLETERKEIIHKKTEATNSLEDDRKVYSNLLQTIDERKKYQDSLKAQIIHKKTEATNSLEDDRKVYSNLLQTIDERKKYQDSLKARRDSQPLQPLDIRAFKARNASLESLIAKKEASISEIEEKLSKYYEEIKHHKMKEIKEQLSSFNFQADECNEDIPTIGIEVKDDQEDMTLTESSIQLRCSDSLSPLGNIELLLSRLKTFASICGESLSEKKQTLQSLKIQQHELEKKIFESHSPSESSDEESPRSLKKSYTSHEEMSSIVVLKKNYNKLKRENDALEKELDEIRHKHEEDKKSSMREAELYSVEVDRKIELFKNSKELITKRVHEYSSSLREYYSRMIGHP